MGRWIEDRPPGPEVSDFARPPWAAAARILRAGRPSTSATPELASIRLRKDLEGRPLARAVWPDEAEYLALYGLRS